MYFLSFLDDDDNIKISGMKNTDEYFQEAAFSMGYKAQDLLPIERRVLELQSQKVTKGMSTKQRQFYLNKKMTNLLQRQNIVFKEVQNQIKRRQFTYKLSTDRTSKLHNPAILKLLEDHERMINKNKRYIDTIFKKKAIDKSIEERRRTISTHNQRNSGDSFRNNESGISNKSKQTNRSHNSADSNRSTTSNKERLMIIRQREKDQMESRKLLYWEKQKQDSRKFLNAMENVSRKSQRIKTKTAVSKQIVDENKREIDFIKNQEIKNHLESLKFKMRKTEQIRQNNTAKKEERSRASEDRGLRKNLEDEKKRYAKSRYDEKQKLAFLRHQNQSLIKNQARNFNKMMEHLKVDKARKNREEKKNQEHHFLENVKQYQEYRLRTAEVNRTALKNVSKDLYIEREIKHDIARMNLQSVNSRRLKQTQELRKKMDHKIYEIKEIDEIKRKLTKERQKFKRGLTFERKSREISTYKPQFNSFFDI